MRLADSLYQKIINWHLQQAINYKFKQENLLINPINRPRFIEEFNLFNLLNRYLSFNNVNPIIIGESDLEFANSFFQSIVKSYKNNIFDKLELDTENFLPSILINLDYLSMICGEFCIIAGKDRVFYEVLKVRLETFEDYVRDIIKQLESALIATNRKQFEGTLKNLPSLERHEANSIIGIYNNQKFYPKSIIEGKSKSNIHNFFLPRIDADCLQGKLENYLLLQKLKNNSFEPGEIEYSSLEKVFPEEICNWFMELIGEPVATTV